jgi:hypothetical protein
LQIFQSEVWLGLENVAPNSVLILCIGAIFASGVNPYQPKTPVTFRFLRVQFAGRYRNRLTVEDVRQIIAVAQQRAEIKKPVDQIETLGLTIAAANH